MYLPSVAMVEMREPSHPPSEPQGALVRASADLAAADRPVRIQLFVALLLGLVLVASGLYLWRRPRGAGGDAAAATAELVDAGVGAPGAASVAGGSMAADAGAAAPPITVTDARVLACMDRGPHKTPPEECDHLQPIEQALMHAITDAASCVPSSAGGGTIEYLADVSFSKKKINLSLPKAGRSLGNKKALIACSAAVRTAIQGVSLDGINHTHARYKISMTATYPGPNKH
jgi:hypothetical protein